VGWREAGALLERWRKDLKTLTVELKQPRVTLEAGSGLTL